MELDYQEIGRNIRRFRQGLGMKQKDLAELIHVSDQHISHIENAYTKLSLVTLVAISNALKVDCNTLLGERSGSVEGNGLPAAAFGSYRRDGREKAWPCGRIMPCLERL